jgi:hypothetical protein
MYVLLRVTSPWFVRINTCTVQRDLNVYPSDTNANCQAIRRGNVTPSDIADATSKTNAVSKYLEQMARELPSSSAAHIYASLSKVLCAQLAKILHLPSEGGVHPPGAVNDPNLNTTAIDWLGDPNEPLGSDPFPLFDMGLLFGEQGSLVYGDFSGMEEFSSTLILG